MLKVFVILLVTSQSYQSDVALLLGSDSNSEFEIYTSHQNKTSTCLEGSIITYPGNFSGEISAVYLDNIGVFLCGGSISNDYVSTFTEEIKLVINANNIFWGG